MYDRYMKYRDLIHELKRLGFWEVPGGKHEKWTDGLISIPVPRPKGGREMKRFTAEGILRNARMAAANRSKK